jgi:hypothetical protein
MARTPATGDLRLPPDVGVGQEAATAIEGEWNTLGNVDARLHMKGIHPLVVPDVQYAEVTAEAMLTADWREFSTTFSAQMRWVNYVVRLLAEVRAYLLQVDNEMDDIERMKRRDFRMRPKHEKMTAIEMEDYIHLDPHYRDLKLLKQELEQERIKIDAWYQALDRSCKTVSRQIENRKAELQGGARESNMSGHGPDTPEGRWHHRKFG